MDSSEYILKSLRQEITENILQLKAIIQDINTCSGPLTQLQNLNSAGRAKIATIRKHLDKFSDIAKESNSQQLLKDLVLQREQLASTMDTFRKSNIEASLSLQKEAKEELLKSKDEHAALRHRQKRDKDHLAKVNSSITDQLLSISRQLADTTVRSADTLSTLTSSSDTVFGTQEELKETSGVINQSGKLLAKYGRREFTDKLLIFFATAFFCACVFYIVRIRLF